jgi:outer membrane protein
VKVEEDQLNLITAQKNLDVARANLNYLMGLDVNEAISVAEIAPPVDLNLTYENAVKIALENHPALKKAQYQTRSAQKEIKMAYSAILPQLKGSYHFGYSSPAFDDMLHPFQGEFNWSAGVTLSLRLFDGLSSQANISRAKIWKRVAQDNYNQVQRDVCLELKAAYVGLEEAKKSIAVATERVLSAEEDLKLSTARYELGSGTMLEQIDAQTALTSARAQKIQAEYDYCFAQSRVKKAIGLLK